MCAKLSREIARLVPDGSLKDGLTDLYYRLYYNPKHFHKNGFRIGYAGGAFEYSFESGVKIRTHDNLEDEIRRSLLGYIARHEIKEGQTVLDCGAEAGEFAIYAAKAAGPSGRVIVFEPDPASAAVIKKNIALNGLDNIVIVTKGVWNSDTTLLYSKDQKKLVSGGAGGDGVSNVPVAAIDKELARLGVERVDFIKMDVEGAEVEALKGASATMQKYQPDFAIASYHDIGGKKSCVELERILGGMGYFVETGHPRHLTTYAVKSKKILNNLA